MGAKTRSADEDAKRGVLAHMEHLRTLGEALTKAVDSYMAGHQAAEAEGGEGWKEDLQSNVADAANEFHRSVAEAPKKVLETYLADEDEDSGKASSKSRKASG